MLADPATAWFHLQSFLPKANAPRWKLGKLEEQDRGHDITNPNKCILKDTSPKWSLNVPGRFALFLSLLANVIHRQTPPGVKGIAWGFQSYQSSRSKGMTRRQGIWITTKNYQKLNPQNHLGSQTASKIQEGNWKKHLQKFARHQVVLSWYLVTWVVEVFKFTLPKTTIAAGIHDPLP